MYTYTYISKTVHLKYVQFIVNYISNFFLSFFFKKKHTYLDLSSTEQEKV